MKVDQQQLLAEASEETLRVLAGLIRAVEKDAGIISRAIARATSMIVLSFGSFILSSFKV